MHVFGKSSKLVHGCLSNIPRDVKSYEQWIFGVLYIKKERNRFGKFKGPTQLTHFCIKIKTQTQEQMYPFPIENNDRNEQNNVLVCFQFARKVAKCNICILDVIFNSGLDGQNAVQVGVLACRDILIRPEC